MQEIMAVSHVGWMTGEAIRAISFLLVVGIVVGTTIWNYFQHRIADKKWEMAEMERKETAWRKFLLHHPQPQGVYRAYYSDLTGWHWFECPKPKRRKDHPLTDFFKRT
jgi:hypothetical protein